MFQTVNIFLPILYLGLDRAYAREYHEAEDKERLFLNLMSIPFVLSLIVFVLFVWNAAQISALLFGSADYTLAVYLMGFSFIGIVFEHSILTRIRMEERALAHSIFTLGMKLAVAISIVLFVVFIRTDFLAIVYATTIGSLLCRSILCLRYFEFLKIKRLQIDTALLKRSLRFAAPLLIASALGLFLRSSGMISLRHFSDFEQLGLFTVGTKISNMLMVMHSAFSLAWVPTYYKWYEAGKKTSDYQRVSEAALAVMSFGFLALLLFRPLIGVFFSQQFMEVGHFISFLSLFPILSTLTATTAMGIEFSRKSYFKIIVVAVSLGLNILLNVLLVPHHGAIGAAIAVGLSYVVYFLMSTYLSFRVWKGFAIYKHLLVIGLMLALSFIDLLYPNYSLYVIILLAFVFALVHKKIILYAMKEGRKWHRGRKSKYNEKK